MPEEATFPPTTAWTDHERMLVLYRIANQMQRVAQRSLRPGDPLVITPEVVFSWGERIQFVVSWDRETLEANRAAILVGLEQLEMRTEV